MTEFYTVTIYNGSGSKYFQLCWLYDLYSNHNSAVA